MTDKFGRIWFEGNPWPNGHAIKSAELSVLLTEDNDERWPYKAGAYLQLRIESENYYAEMSDEEGERAYDREAAQIDAGEELDDWESYIVWQNYHACWIEAENAIIGTRDAPFTLDALQNHRFRFEPGLKRLSDSVEEQNAFACYVIGHDAVADHDLRFRQAADRPHHFDMDWTGAVARAYVGGDEFEHSFRAKLRAVPFGGLGAARMLELRTRQDYPDLKQETEWYDRRQEYDPAERERKLRALADAMLIWDQSKFRFHAGQWRDWLVPIV